MKTLRTAFDAVFGILKKIASSKNGSTGPLSLDRALQAVVTAQKAGGVAVFVDSRQALDLDFARRIGVDLDDLLVAQPDSTEEALAICERLASSGTVEVIVLDSLAALVSQAEIDGETHAVCVGLQSRLLSRALRKLTSARVRTGTLCLFTDASIVTERRAA